MQYNDIMPLCTYDKLSEWGEGGRKNGSNIAIFLRLGKNLSGTAGFAACGCHTTAVTRQLSHDSWHTTAVTRQLTHDSWHRTADTVQLSHDSWHRTAVTRQLAQDSCHTTADTGQLTQDSFHTTADTRQLPCTLPIKCRLWTNLHSKIIIFKKPYSYASVF